MIIVFRTDASDIIGTGHVFRCLNLAHQYKEKHTIYFICKNHDYNLISKIEETYQVFQIKLEKNNNITLDMNTWLGENEIQEAENIINIIQENELQIDWLIVDHYAINETWENKVSPYVKNICVIDDFTNRKHNCNILINQQITREEGIFKYKNIINTNCKIYCGNNYLLLHPKYFEYNITEKKYQKKKVLKRINIFMGGSDTYNITEKIIDTCYKFNQEQQKENKIIFDVIIGKSNKYYKQVQEKINKLNYISSENKDFLYFNLYYNLDFIGDLFQKADLCIGAPGSTSYERCLMKIPSLCICIAENQKTVLDKFIESNTIKYLGTIVDNYLDKLIYYLEYFQKNDNELKMMSHNCEQLINIKNNQIKYILNV
jgi:UDP-2,4-diacetamido-2,4,6-trideoxy-beta-L-altropyranose hydrolase